MLVIQKIILFFIGIKKEKDSEELKTNVEFVIKREPDTEEEECCNTYTGTSVNVYCKGRWGYLIIQ